MEFWWAYVLLGIVCGVFSIVFGVGSGILLIPALTMIPIFYFPQKSAQGICLAVMVPMALVGAVRYKLDPEIDVNMAVVALLAAGAVGGAFIGFNITAVTPGSTLRKLFACIMIVAAIRMLTTPASRKAVPEPEPAAPTTEKVSSETPQ